MSTHPTWTNPASIHSKEALREVALELPEGRANLKRAILVSGTPLLLGLVLVAWWGWTRLPWGQFALILGAGGCLTAFAAWFVAWSSVNYGIVRGDAGVEIYQDQLMGRTITRFVVPWQLLRRGGGDGRTKWIEAEGIPLLVGYDHRHRSLTSVQNRK